MSAYLVGGGDRDGDSFAFGGSSGGGSSYTFDEIRVDDGALSVEGVSLSPAEVKQRFAGTLGYGDHGLAFEPRCGGSVVITVNGQTTLSKSGGLHLDSSPMSPCVGDKCIVWPAPAPKDNFAQIA